MQQLSAFTWRLSASMLQCRSLENNWGSFQKQRNNLYLFYHQELARYTLAELLSELVQAENEAMDSEDLSRGAEQEDVRLELERAAGPQLAPRERKAGCKNFFWKTFTSC